MTVQTEGIAAHRRAVVGDVKRLIIDSLQLDLEPAEISEDCPLFGFGLGLDSIDALTLVVAVEAGFDIDVADEDVHVLSSVNAVADFVLARRPRDGSDEL
jgi:acyl carrier protein